MDVVRRLRLAKPSTPNPTDFCIMPTCSSAPTRKTSSLPPSPSKDVRKNELPSQNEHGQEDSVRRASSDAGGYPQFTDPQSGIRRENGIQPDRVASGVPGP